MRKNQSKYKNKEYVDSLISKATSFNNITFKQIIDVYAYFNCDMHGEFRKRLDHLVEIKHHVCPKCSKQIYSRIVGDILAQKKNLDDFVDYDKYEVLSEFKGVGNKMTFKCKKHNKVFEATPKRLFGCDECKKEHHYKWKKDWRHIDQEEIIRRCREIHPEYDYSMVNYVNSTTPIDVICPKHGVFSMSYANLTNKTKPQKCPFCSKMGTHKISKMTQEVLNYLDNNNIEYKTEQTFKDLKDKKVLPIDIYLPKYNAVIECQGVQHFRFVKSFNKTLDGFEYIKKHDKMKYEYFKNHPTINLYYYTSIYNKNLIPTNYFDKVFINIEELITNIINSK